MSHENTWPRQLFRSIDCCNCLISLLNIARLSLSVGFLSRILKKFFSQGSALLRAVAVPRKNNQSKETSKKRKALQMNANEQRAKEEEEQERQRKRNREKEAQQSKEERTMIMNGVLNTVEAMLERQSSVCDGTVRAMMLLDKLLLLLDVAIGFGGISVQAFDVDSGVEKRVEKVVRTLKEELMHLQQHVEFRGAAPMPH